VPAATNRKVALVHALSACTDNPYRAPARRFLQGLATDELQYIAEFLGSCILESGGRCHCSRTQLAEAVKQFDRSRSSGSETANGNSRRSVQDHEHKMILLLEYLCRSGLTRFTIGVGAGS
jgi:hypothetical protein